MTHRSSTEFRIAIASPGAGATWRGYEIFAVQLAQHLDALGANVLFLHGGAIDHAEGTHHSKRVRRLDRRSLGARAASLLLPVGPHSIEQYSFAAAAVRDLHEFQPDAIVASESVLLALWNKLRSTTGRMESFDNAAFILTNGGSRTPPFHYADLVIHHANDLCERAASVEAPLKHTSLSCPINISEWDAVLQKRAAREEVLAGLGIPAQRRLIVAVGAIDTAVKRLDYIAQELATVADVHDLHLLMLGRESPNDPGLLNEVRSILPGRSTARFVEHDHVGRYYAAADAHVSASLSEGFGRVFTEAQAWGTPNVVHDTARTRAILGEPATIYYDATQAGQLARCLVKAFDRSDRREAWKNTSAHHSWDALGEQYLQAIASAITRRRGRQ